VHSTFAVLTINRYLMLIKNSKYYSKVLESFKTDMGNVHFFENLIISEVNEGKHFSFKNGKDYVDLMLDFYGTSKPIGYISNRMHQFSVNPLDFDKFFDTLPNLKCMTTVYYNAYNLKNIDIERQFCKIPYYKFEDVNKAYDYINTLILNKSTVVNSVI